MALGKHQPTCKKSSITKIKYLENKDGGVEIGFCGDCGIATYVLCEHKNNKWIYTRNEVNPEEQKLICELCGMDGT